MDTMDTPELERGPALEQVGDGVYFTDQAGVRWRVYDVCFGPPHCALGKRRGYRPPEPRANYRWFISANGTERCVKLEGERAVTAEVLARQLAQSSYYGKHRFDSSTHGS